MSANPGHYLDHLCIPKLDNTCSMKIFQYLGLKVYFFIFFLAMLNSYHIIAQKIQSCYILSCVKYAYDIERNKKQCWRNTESGKHLSTCICGPLMLWGHNAWQELGKKMNICKITSIYLWTYLLFWDYTLLPTTKALIVEKWKH